MRRPKRDVWRVGIALAGLLVLLLLMVLIPLSADAHTDTSELATPGTVQPTPTVDLTVTALAKEQLTLQVRQLQNQLENQNNWLANNSTALIAAVATVIVALFGILQWAITVRQAKDKELRDREDERRKEIAVQEKELKDRQAAHDKDLRAQAEEQFKAAVTALGSENEAIQVGGAILLRSFLNKEDEAIYGRYYTQIFDLAVAYLRLSSKSQPQDSDPPLPLTPLRLALIAVFKEAFPLARDWIKEHNPETPFNPRSLDASHVNLDNAYLMGADLEQAWMPMASLRETNLDKATLSEANLREADLNWTKVNEADLRGAELKRADLREAKLRRAKLNEAELRETDLRGADLREAIFLKAILSRAILSRANLSDAKLSGVDLQWANFSNADLQRADLQGANLRVANLEDARSLKDTDLRKVKGLTKEQLEACKAKGAIIDEDMTTSTPQPPIASPAPAQSSDINGSNASVSQQSNNAQAPSAPPAQVNAPPPSTDGSSSTAAQPNAEP